MGIIADQAFKLAATPKKLSISFAWLGAAKRKVCGISLAEAEAQSNTENKILEEVAKEFGDRVLLYDPKTVLCPKNFCWSINDGKVFFRDADHLSDYGSSFVANDLLGKFPKMQ